MKTHPDPWQRLVAAAREADPSEGPVDVPVGFATRVLAQARSRPPGGNGYVEKLAWRILAMASCITLLSLFWSITPSTNTTASNDEQLVDPVAEVIALTQV